VAAGGGAGLALAGDALLAARSARFVLTFVPKLGLVPDVGATWLMTRMAGRARTLAASLLGDAISAEQAERWGLVYQLHDDDQLMAEAMKVCRRLADGPRRRSRVCDVWWMPPASCRCRPTSCSSAISRRR
jgi:2-(1,2-epoxy-1,2-dihydrophenyl)acetyl-CoA isomerase